MTEQKIQWHPAFYAAMRIELEQDADILDFIEEYQLSHKPMQVDVVVVKKVLNVQVRKNIGHIFRGHNIIQYKSPEDYLNVTDFYKTYGYACFYQAVTNCNPRDITITCRYCEII